MTTPRYSSSAIDGRIRLRDPLLKTAEGQAMVKAVLQKQKKVREIVPGHGSLLVFFDADLKLTTLCAALEKEIPEWREEKKSGHTATFALAEGLSARKIELRFLLCTLGIGALLGLVGSGKAHTAFSLLAMLCTTRHIWQRRKSL